MAVKLADLRKVTPTEPPRLCIYGPPGIGKTSLAAEFPNTVFLQTEFSAITGVELNSFGHLKTYDDVMSAIGELYDGEHDFKTVTLDSIDAMQPLVWQETCKLNNWKDIEAPGYGKGYLAADSEWRELLKRLNYLRTDRKMNVILIGHSDIERFDDPQTTSYSIYNFRAHKRAHAIIEEEVDCLFFLNQDPTIKVEELGFKKERARAEGGQSVWIHTERRAVFNAKNRYNMPARILYQKGKGYAALRPYLPAQDGEPTVTGKAA